MGVALAPPPCLMLQSAQGLNAQDSMGCMKRRWVPGKRAVLAAQAPCLCRVRLVWPASGVGAWDLLQEPAARARLQNTSGRQRAALRQEPLAPSGQTERRSRLRIAACQAPSSAALPAVRGARRMRTVEAKGDQSRRAAEGQVWAAWGAVLRRARARGSGRLRRGPRQTLNPHPQRRGLPAAAARRRPPDSAAYARFLAALATNRGPSGAESNNRADTFAGSQADAGRDAFKLACAVRLHITCCLHITCFYMFLEHEYKEKNIIHLLL